MPQISKWCGRVVMLLEYLKGLHGKKDGEKKHVMLKTREMSFSHHAPIIFTSFSHHFH